MNDKKGIVRSRNVVHKADERQKRVLFVIGLSFISVMNDKKGIVRNRNVVHKGDERQKK
ncbi:hypothetical protein [Metabacillus litoralis]|uniref:hypothetical protein n=1 Tax=Metabacillus litoralis TaxID=152268 RepID=UPI002040F18B|nr:hypothetical protein [Metabacillus litoralis]MCM3412241.1 hypothetical protein [Metabacillus litoralis]